MVRRVKAQDCSRGSSGVGAVDGACPFAIGSASTWSMPALSFTTVLGCPTANPSGAITSTRRWREAFLEAMQPAQLEVSMAALDQLAERSRKIDRQWQLARERVRYEADLAERRFKAVDPENRLVARSLEREWNEKLTEVERLERENLQRPNLSVRLVDPEERQRILALAQDLPQLWHAATTTNVERKQLLGFLVKDVTLYAEKTKIEISIRWQTEACTTLEVPRFRRMWDLRRTDPAVVERIRALAATKTDGQIASELNGTVFSREPRTRSPSRSCISSAWRTGSRVAAPSTLDSAPKEGEATGAIRPGPWPNCWAGTCRRSWDGVEAGDSTGSKRFVTAPGGSP